MKTTQIILLSIILVLIFSFTGCKEQATIQSESASEVNFEELWNRYTNPPEEYEVSWTEDLISSNIPYKEFRKGNNWVLESKSPFDVNEDIYLFSLDGKAYTCDSLLGEPECRRNVMYDFEEIPQDQLDEMLFSYYSNIPSTYENSRNFKDPVFGILKGMLENKAYQGNAISMYEETIDDLRITKTTHENDGSAIDCYQFIVTSKQFGNAEMSIQSMELMRDQATTKEEKENYNKLIEMMKQEAENPAKEIKVCFNEHNILTYSNKGFEPITDKIYELDSFSVNVEDSVFELPYTAETTFSDVVETSNAEQCQQLEDPYTEFLCITRIAVDSNDPTICMQTHNSMIPECLDRFVKNRQGYFRNCPAGIGYPKTNVCAVPVACTDAECSKTIEMGYKIYPKCDQDPDCGFPGASELVKPICESYDVRSEDSSSSENYMLCV